MMKKPANLVYFVLMALLTGCNVAQALSTVSENSSAVQAVSSPVAITHSPSATITAIKTSFLTSSLTPTPTLLPNKANTPTPTATPTIPPEVHLQFQCLEVAPMLPPGAKSSGILVLQSTTPWNNGRYKSNTYLHDVITSQAIQIAEADENQAGVTISPDGKLMAYKSVLFDKAGKIIQENLVISSADGQRLKVLPWEEGWVRLPGWLGNKQLILNLAGLDAEENKGEKPATLLALNPFTGERQVLKADFPGMYNHPASFWEGWSGRVYDPMLTRAAYVQAIDEKQEIALALWDLQKKQVLGRLLPYYSLSMPRWSPDGSRLVTSALVEDPDGRELFLMGRDGRVEQLTNLLPYAGATGSLYSWSPDGRYIANWIAKKGLPKGKNGAELIIIDTDTRQVTDYCVWVSVGGDGYNSYPVPIWSPDGKQLVLYDWYEKDHSRVILVDLEHGYAAQIAEDMEPMGWMLAP